MARSKHDKSLPKSRASGSSLFRTKIAKEVVVDDDDDPTIWTFDKSHTSVLERLGTRPQEMVASGIHTPPMGVETGTVSRKRRRQEAPHHHHQTSLQDNDPLTKSQAYKESQATRRPVSRRGAPAGVGIGVTAPAELPAAKKQSSINTFMKTGLALASVSSLANRAIRTCYSSGSDYTIPKKKRLNPSTSTTDDPSRSFISTDSAETRLVTTDGHKSPRKIQAASTFSSFMTKGLRKRAATTVTTDAVMAADNDSVVDLSMEDSDQKLSAPTKKTTRTTTPMSSSTVINKMDSSSSSSSSSSPPDSITDEAGYLTQDDSSNTPTSRSAAAASRGMKSDDAVCSGNWSSRDFRIGQTKSKDKNNDDDDDDEGCEVVSGAVLMTSHTQNSRRRTSKVTPPEITEPKVSPPLTSASLFRHVGPTPYSQSSPVQSVEGICARIQDIDQVETTTTTSSHDKVETTLNRVRSEKITTRRDGISVTDLLLRNCRIQGRGATVQKAQKSAWTLTKVNGTKVPTLKKSKGKPLNATATTGQQKATTFFGRSRAVPTTATDEFESISDTDDVDTIKFRSTPPAENPRMKLRSSKKSPISHGADNPIEIDDSDDDGAPHVQSLKARVEEQVDLARVTIGAEYSHTECKLELMSDQLSLYYTLKTEESTTKGHHPIALDEIELFHYYTSKKRGIVLAIMRVAPTESNGLDKISRYLRFVTTRNESLRRQRGYIVLELRSKENLQRLLEWMSENDLLRPFIDDNNALSADDCRKYAETMLEKIELEKKERENSLASPRKRRRRGSKVKTSSDSNDIMLVFPFGANEEKIDSAAENLIEAQLVLDQAMDNNCNSVNIAHARRNSGNETQSPKFKTPIIDSDAAEIKTDNAPIEEATTAEEAKAKARAHYLTIRQEDFDRLEPGEFLNDTLIDFWMQWLTRKEDRQSSPVHIFSSHFYTTLRDDGTDAVESWTARKNIDVFSKRFIFIPINKSLHWSLCVVVNPASIRAGPNAQDAGNGSSQPQEIDLDDEPFPCILFLDSLKAHRKEEVANHVRKWLNAEWKRLKKEPLRDDGPFTASAMGVFAPLIPYQDNCWDCGVFVCRYAFALFMLRNRVIKFGDSDTKREALNDAISNRKEFQFDMGDIERMRQEMKVLISRLATSYQAWSTQEAAQRKLEADTAQEVVGGKAEDEKPHEAENVAANNRDSAADISEDDV